MRHINNLIRILLSILACMVFIAMIPIYNEPFTGCLTRGFATLELGCTLWLDVLLGFGIVLIFAWIGPNRWWPQLWGFAIVTTVSIMGGLSAIKSGIYLDIFSHPANMVFYWRGSGIAIFLGGLLGLGLYYLFFFSRSVADRDHT